MSRFWLGASLGPLGLFYVAFAGTDLDRMIDVRESVTEVGGRL
jgi:hypothetical protein